MLPLEPNASHTRKQHPRPSQQTGSSTRVASRLRWQLARIGLQALRPSLAVAGSVRPRRRFAVRGLPPGSACGCVQCFGGSPNTASSVGAASTASAQASSSCTDARQTLSRTSGGRRPNRRSSSRFRIEARPSARPSARTLPITDSTKTPTVVAPIVLRVAYSVPRSVSNASRIFR